MLPRPPHLLPANVQRGYHFAYSVPVSPDPLTPTMRVRCGPPRGGVALMKKCLIPRPSPASPRR